MSALPRTQHRYSVKEYYELEDLAEVRHEFHDGEILAMAGGSMSHSQICVNTVGELRQRLKGKSCQAFESNLRSRIEASNRNVYFDVSVVCGPVQLDPRDPSKGTLLNPTVVIEIISPSTERYDRTEKRDHYLRIPTLQTHVLIEQDRPRAEVLNRTGDGRWEVSFAVGMEETLSIPSLQLHIPMRDVYDRVEFPPPGPVTDLQSA